MPRLTRWLRLYLALALLSAQYAALAHQIWHSVDQKSQPAQQQLCGQHDALGTVAGALNTVIPATSLQAAAPVAHHPVLVPAAESPGLAPSSRGPPASP